jgi:hypothetical protein
MQLHTQAIAHLCRRVTKSTLSLARCVCEGLLACSILGILGVHTEPCAHTTHKRQTSSNNHIGHTPVNMCPEHQASNIHPLIDLSTHLYISALSLSLSSSKACLSVSLSSILASPAVRRRDSLSASAAAAAAADCRSCTACGVARARVVCARQCAAVVHACMCVCVCVLVCLCVCECVKEVACVWALVCAAF